MWKWMLLLWSMVVTTGFAQSPAILSVYTTREGLPSNHIRGIALDQDRQLWVSTDNGLLLFHNAREQGRAKQLLQAKRGTPDEHHLINNDLNMIYADRYEPVLWIATRGNGLDAYHYRDNHFEHFSSPDLPDGSVTSIAPDGPHLLWFTSYQGGFYRLDKRKMEFLQYHHSHLHGMPNDSLWCILPLSSSEVVVGHTNAGITMVDLQRRQAVNYPILPCFSDRYVAEDGVRTIVRDMKGNLWLGAEKGLAFFDMKTRKAKEVKGIKGLVTHLTIHRDTLYICTRDMGVLSLSLSHAYRHPSALRPVPLNLSSQGLSSSMAATTMLVDDNGHRWIGTLEEGLLLMRTKAPYLFSLPLPEEVNGNVTALLAISNTDVWIGTFQNGLYRWNSQTGECKAVPLIDANGGKRIFVNALAQWYDRVMVATGQGLFEINPKDATYHCHTKKGGALTTDYLLSLAVDHHHRLWCGGAYGGIDVLDSLYHRCFTLDKRFLGTELAITHLAPLGRDTMVANTDGRLFFLGYHSQMPPRLLSNDLTNHGLPVSMKVTALIADSEGALYCFTSDGVNKMRGSQVTTYYPCEQSEELANCRVATLLPDGGVLWFANKRMGVMSHHPSCLLLPSSSQPPSSLWLWLLGSLTVLVVGGVMTRFYFIHHRPAPQPEESPLPESVVDKAFVEKLQSTIERLDSLASLNRDSLAEEMCMSKSTLYRRMKQVLGQSPNEWLRLQRLERARQLLAQGLNVSETAEKVGLDAAYLARCYKEQYGVYPSEMKR